MNLGDEYFLLKSHKKQFYEKYHDNHMGFAHWYMLHLYNCEHDRIILKNNKEDVDKVANLPMLSRIIQVQNLWKDLIQKTVQASTKVILKTKSIKYEKFKSVTVHDELESLEKLHNKLIT
uniref:Uncharacterized protein n=1 Tax=viral metagenome TaxID=1070528 RepID=A0A6C0F8H2_9ZZZZ|tara:strand:+ start:14976 stop:15335 length:360 start_codon:yes stop_codon:yes gene_type:complete